MPEISHTQLPGLIDRPTGQDPLSVCLIHGVPQLVAHCQERLIAHLLAGESRDVACEVISGLPEHITDVLAQLNTYALLSGPKIVLFKDAKLFEAGVDAEEGLQLLDRAIERGFPPGHHLIVTVYAKVPANRKFFKTVKSRGLVVNCHVPLGERRADKAEQDAVLKTILEEALHRTGKRMHPSLIGKLLQLTGFDPATFRGNVEKLIDYVGKQAEITESDVDYVLRRTRGDALYELTNALADRNARAALSFVESLVKDQWHPLQIVAALANQVRKLLVAKDFITSASGAAWISGMGYPQFQSAVMPAIQSFDAQVAETAREHTWGPEMSGNEAKKSRIKGGGADLTLAPNPGNAYPVFQTLLKSEKFTHGELVGAMERLSDTDVRLKSTGQDAVSVLNAAIVAICGVH